jgi:hypothetical protein
MELPSAPKGEAAAVLAARMEQADHIVAQWQALPAAEREALADLLSAGVTLWQAFTRSWGEVRRMGPARLERERPWEQPVSPAEELWYRGLVFHDLQERPDGLAEVAVVPDEVRQVLPTPPVRTLCLAPVAAPPHVVPARPALADDACTLLAYLQNHRVRPGVQGEWPARHQASLVPRLRDPDPQRLALLRNLTTRLGWLRASGHHLLPEPAPVMAWLQATAAEQQAALAGAWRDDPTWNDLWNVPTLRPDDTGSWRNDPVRARHAVLHHLSACSPDQWYAVETFVAGVKDVDPDFQRPGGDYTSWYIRDAATGEHLSGFEAWDRVEGALIRHLITGPMTWLALLDFAAEREGDPPAAFRLSPFGATFLGLTEPLPESEPPPLTTSSGATVMVPAARRYERFQLSRVADWVCTADPYVYRLTGASLARARRQGVSVGRVEEFLETACGEALPPVIRSALVRWDARGTEVRLERGILLRVEDDSLLRQLMASPATRRFVREVVGPNVALVDPTDWPRLVQALVQEGLLADVVGLEGSDAT